PVGLVVAETAAQPDHALGAEVLEQGPFDLLARAERVAVRVQQALFGRQHGSLSVDVDRAALEHYRSAVARGAFDLEDLSRYAFVAVPREVQALLETAPGVEAPIHAAPPAVLIDEETRACVPH